MKARRSNLLIALSILVLLGLAYFFIEKPKDSLKEAESRGIYVVENVVDGDTIEIKRQGRIEKVRMIGIDTPETLDPRKPVQCFGKEASDFSKRLMGRSSVRIEFDPIVGERDKYNRLLAYVWLENGDMVNAALVREGYAHEYTYRSQDYKYQSEFKQAQAQAKSESRGLWSSSTCNGQTK